MMAAPVPETLSVSACALRGRRGCEPQALDLWRTL